MTHQNFALHETMEIHELLNFNTIGMLKSKLAQGIVFDQELKALLQKDVQMSINAATSLQNLLTKTQPQ